MKKFLLLFFSLIACVAASYAEKLEFAWPSGNTWGTGYTNSGDWADANVTVKLDQFARQTQTITNRPVTKGGTATLTLNDSQSSLESVTFKGIQWTTKTKTMKLSYSTDGTNFKEFSPAIFSTTFQVTATEIPEGTTHVRLSFSEASNQVGVDYVEYTLSAGGGSQKEAVSLSFPKASYSVNIGEGFQAPVLSCNPDAVAGDVEFTSSNTAVATVDASTGAVEIVGVGETNITASYAGNDEYKEATASYTLSVIDPNAIETVLNVSFFKGSGSYNVYTQADAVTGIEYTTVFYTESNKNMQFNTGNTNGKGSGIAVTAISPDYIISKIDIKFSNANGKGLNVYKKDVAFEKQTKTKAIDLTNVTQVGNLVGANMTVYIDAPAFALVPSGTTYVESVKVYYALPASKVEISSVLNADNKVEVTLSSAASNTAIYYGFSENEINNEYTGPFIVEENCTVYACTKNGDKFGPVSSAEIKVPYKSFKTVVAEAQNGETLTIVGNFATLAPQQGNYLMLTDGTDNILVFGQTSKFASGTPISKIEATVNYRTGLFRLYDATLTEGGEGATITSTPISSLDEINYTDNLFDLIKIENCDISGKVGDNATISFGESSVALSNIFKLDFNNGVKYDITGFVWRYNDELQVCPTLIENGEFAETVKTPVITPDKRELQLHDVVTITCATEGATIYYTVDGSQPDNSSTKYEGAFSVYGDVVVKAIAYYEADDKVMLPSEIAEKTYHAANPYCNVITTENHEGKDSYTKHTCVVDGVDYAMYGFHNVSQGIQMNNASNRFCYIVQTGDNEGLALDNIEVEFHAEPAKVDMALEIRGSNTPFDVFAENDYDYNAEGKSIKENGVVIGRITYNDNKLYFPKDYNYFALYPTINGAVYMDAITINYRDPQPMADAPVIDDDFAENFDGDEYSFMFWGVPGHEDWTAYYTLNDGDVRKAETGGDGVNVHEELEAATLHTIKIWYEHYYYPETSTVYEFHHVTQPEFIFDENKAESKSEVYFGNIGDGVTVYFTLNGTEPVVPDATPARVMRRTGVSEDGTYVIDSHDDYDKTHVVPQSGMVDIKHGVIYDGGSKDGVPDFYQFRAMAVHDNGTKSAIVENDKIPTSIREVGAAEAGNGAVYDLMGRKVVAPVRGLYIQNGAKRLVR